MIDQALISILHITLVAFVVFLFIFFAIFAGSLAWSGWKEMRKKG